LSRKRGASRKALTPLNAPRLSPRLIPGAAIFFLAAAGFLRRERRVLHLYAMLHDELTPRSAGSSFLREYSLPRQLRAPAASR
jgi:hypothetical protein